MTEVFENNNQLRVYFYFNRYYDNYPFFTELCFNFSCFDTSWTLINNLVTFLLPNLKSTFTYDHTLFFVEEEITYLII